MSLGINEKAWEGINIVIFGKKALVPMQIEQAISAVSPANEVRIDSFEDYDQAYDFCKAQKNVGMIFMIESNSAGLVADTFKQLGSHYESRGWPCFGVLLHEKDKSMLGYLSLKNNKNLIDYRPVSDFLDNSKTFSTLSEIWQTFVNAFEERLIPEKLKETLLSLSQPSLSQDSFNFRQRLSTLLSKNLNISWLEMLALRWQPVVYVLKRQNPKALDANQALVEIAELASPHENVKDIIKVIQMRTNLPSRVSTIIHLLDEARSQGKLEAVLNALKTEIKPGAPAVLRHLIGAHDNILSIATDYKSPFLRQVI